MDQNPKLNQHAVALGRLGGLAGRGRSKARKLSKAKAKEMGRLSGKARRLNAMNKGLEKLLPPLP